MFSQLNENISYEPPREMNPEIVKFHEPMSKALLQISEIKDWNPKTLLTKAKKILENDCIKYIGNGKYNCLPIANYNKSTYVISFNNSEIGHSCSCQGFADKMKKFEEGHSDIRPICAHIIAVKQWKFIQEYNGEKII
jgi:hypothetical protein